MVPSSVFRHRGAPRPQLRLTLPLLAALALAAAGCATNSNSGSPRAHVLGAPKGTPLVLGQPAPAGTGELGAVSCATARRCWAVGVARPSPAASGSPTVIVATRNGGRTWRAQHVTGGSTPQLSGVSCPGPADCMAVGSNGASLPGSGVVLATTDGGASWNPVTAPNAALTVLSVTCSSETSCLAVVNDGTLMWSAVSTDFGRTWVREGNLPFLFTAGDDISCTDGGTCLVAGYATTGTGTGQGAVALSTDGGQTWTLASVPNGVGVLHSATCADATDCLAAGSSSMSVNDVVPAQGALLHSTDGGHTWQPATGSPPVADVFDIECPSPTVCAMVGTLWKGNPAVATGAVAQSFDAGTTFRLSSAAYVPLTLTALSCPTVTACIAVGSDTVAQVSVKAPPPRHGSGRSHATAP